MSRRRKVTNAEIGGPLPLRRRPSSYIDHDDGVARYSTGDGAAVRVSRSTIAKVRFPRK